VGESLILVNQHNLIEKLQYGSTYNFQMEKSTKPFALGPAKNNKEDKGILN
jgi:hypothetical protein